ncbi:hypothetical protein Dsin_028029 [Dipteronia sinensis]|uniref:Cytochrome P450 n=1 Tax=Dipteronia sinensis TaxID=43782 RepID=A0AAE0DTV2_9ROSI|nr:hypothetical protein Dsin_028029 [Dipteronia sinensis]
MVGNLPEMFRNKPTFRWIHKLMKEMNTYIVCISLGNVHVIAVTCPKISKEILSKQDTVFASRSMSMSTEMTTRDKYHEPIIEERIRQWRIGFKKEIEDLLDVFITLKDGASNSLLSTNEINAQIMEIMAETVDNPSNAVEWAIAEMINQPEILEKAIKELDRVVGN